MEQYSHEVIILTTFKRDFNFNKNIKEFVSKNIRKYRLKAGITQEQLAVNIGKSYDFIRRLEFKKGQIEVYPIIWTVNKKTPIKP